MKLYYYSEHFNFGDALNPWLWSKLLSGILDEDERTAFVGIGTLINERLPYRTPLAQQRVIFSTGVGYENGLPYFNKSDRIYCLRGPLSARALGLDPNLAVTDGAVLLRRCFEPTAQKLHQFAYMPHWQQADCDWQLVCQELGWDYIDPRWSIPKILAAISQTEVLLAEAMHGAIIADALRVQWIPIVTNTGVLTFKWHDWCQSVELEYNPVLMQPPTTFSPLTDPFDRSSLVLDWMSQKQAICQLREIADTVRPQLSENNKIEDLTCELEARLARFQADVQQGDFLPIIDSKKLFEDQKIELIVAQPTPESTILIDLTQFYPQFQPQQIEKLEQGISAIFTPAVANEITTFRREYQIDTPYLLLIGKLDYQFLSVYLDLNQLLADKQIELIYINTQPKSNLKLLNLPLRVLDLIEKSHSIAAYSGAIAIIDLTDAYGLDMAILEAMACGCPVISDRDSLYSSIAGSAILSPKYTDKVTVIEALLIVQIPAIRDRLIQLGLEFARQSSLLKMAQLVTDRLLTHSTEMQTGGLSPSVALSWQKLRLVQRSISITSEYERLSVQHQLSDTQHQLSDTQHQLSDTQHQLSDTQHQLSDTQHQLSDTQQQLSDTQQQLSDAQHQLIDAQHQLIDAHTQIRSMEQTKVWKVRQAWHRIKRS
jgi:succinoglycan biosynthesis protein ExoV